MLVGIDVPSTPHDHLGPRPDRRVCHSASGGVAGGCSYPTVRNWIVPAASVKNAVVIRSAPDNHFAAGPNCGGVISTSRGISSADSCPTIGVGVVFPTGVKIGGTSSTPDNHFVPGPCRRVVRSGIRRIGHTGGHPAICAWIVPAAGIRNGVKPIFPAPDDHFGTSPRCSVTSPPGRRIRVARRCPSISAWIVPCACVPKVKVRVIPIIAAPDDHFASGPHCSVTVSDIGRASGSRPSIISASAA